MSKYDYATRINHIAAEELGRIFGDKGKAQVQAIIDEAVASESLSLRQRLARIAEILRPRLDCMGYPDSPAGEIVKLKFSVAEARDLLKLMEG